MVSRRLFGENKWEFRRQVPILTSIWQIYSQMLNSSYGGWEEIPATC